MLDSNEKIIKDKNKNVIKFLKFFHKKFNLFKLNSLYFYYLYLLYFLSNINNFRFYKTFYNIISLTYLLKLNYIFYYIYYKNEINTNKNINLKKKLIGKTFSNICLLKFKSNYFCFNYDLNILSSFNYKLILNLWYFMLYGKYIIYIVTYLYNLYLNTKCYLLKYPLINVMLRFLLRSRLEKIINFKKYKYSKLRFINKYHIYDIKFKIILEKKFLFNLDIKYVLYKLNVFKILNLLSNKNVYTNLNFIWYRFIKINYLYYIYYLNIYNDYDNSLACEYNKFNILGLFSFYWQLKRYGFNVNYYSYYFSFIYFKFFSINDYNLYYYLFKNNFININLFWYKINKIIVLNHLRKSFFKYIRLNRFILKNKLRRRLIIRKWLFYSNIYNMNFYPLKNILYDKNNIKYFLISFKEKLDYLCCLNLFNFIYKYYNKYTLNFTNIIYKISISEKIYNNYNTYQNYINNLIINKLNNKYYINLLNLLSCLKVFFKNIINRIPNYIYINDKYLIYNKKLNIYYLYRLQGLNKFMELYFIKIKNYLWNFEKSLMYNMFVKYMFHFYLFFFSVFSCFIKLNINLFNSIKLFKNNFIIRIKLPNIIKKKYILIK